MNFHVFDKSEIEQYKAEAKARWGDTKEYQEYEQRQKSGQDVGGTISQLMDLFVEIGTLRQLPRFKHNIDNAGGEGTAAFVNQAIEIYCSK